MASVADTPPEGDPPVLSTGDSPQCLWRRLSSTRSKRPFRPRLEKRIDLLDNFSEPGAPANAFDSLAAEIDLNLDPLANPVSSPGSSEWDVSFSRFAPRVPATLNTDQLTQESSDRNRRVARHQLDARESSLLAWLESIETQVHPVGDFGAGCFSRHLPVWEELMKDSSRLSSKTVLSRVRNGIKPTFVGTAQCDPKKLESVKLMLRRTVGGSKVDEWLLGDVPHPVKFPNHRSFYENAEFAIQTVGEMFVNGSIELCSPDQRKPKVVNPLGVVNLPKGRLVFDAGYINAFSKPHPFRYETLRDILTFLSSSGFVATWDFKAGYYHVFIHPQFRTYLGFKIGAAYFYCHAKCFGWSEVCYA